MPSGGTVTVTISDGQASVDADVEVTVAPSYLANGATTIPVGSTPTAVAVSGGRAYISSIGARALYRSSTQRPRP